MIQISEKVKFTFIKRQLQTAIRLCCAEEKTQSVLFVECFLMVDEILATEFIDIR